MNAAFPLVLGLATVMATLVGCSSVQIPDLATLYNAAAQEDGEWRNPVILIPGILGSRLVDGDSNRVVWGSFTGDYAHPKTEDGARLIALPMGQDVALRELRDGVVSDGALSEIRASWFGIPMTQRAYAYVLAALGVGGFRDEELGETGAIDYGNAHYTCFQFHYDWRRDIAENAIRFHEFLEERRAYVAEERQRRGLSTQDDVHFDVVAHSMGGLLLRYYLRFGAQDLPADGSLPEVTWAGAQHLDRAILIATPNAGSLDALQDLVEGASFSILVPTYPPALVGTMPAMYQLLPRGRHHFLIDADSDAAIEDVLDPELWQRFGWGLSDPAQDQALRMILPEVDSAAQRRSIALDHQRKCLRRAAQFQAAMDQPALAPEGLNLYLVAGDAESTTQTYAVNPRNGELRTLATGAGDGTVLRSSALMDERLGSAIRTPRLRSPIDWRNVLFLFNDHLELTRDPAFLDNILYLLLEDPRRDRRHGE